MDPNCSHVCNVKVVRPTFLNGRFVLEYRRSKQMHLVDTTRSLCQCIPDEVTYFLSQVSQKIYLLSVSNLSC